MFTETSKTEDRSIQTKCRENRTQSIATRFTRAEEQALKKRAEASGQNLREWAREVLLRGDANGRRAEMEMHLFTELVGIEMLMMKTLEPILRTTCVAKRRGLRIRLTPIECFASQTANRRGDSLLTPICSQGPRCNLMARHYH